MHLDSLDDKVDVVVYGVTVKICKKKTQHWFTRYVSKASGRSTRFEVAEQVEATSRVHLRPRDPQHTVYHPAEPTESTSHRTVMNSSADNGQINLHASQARDGDDGLSLDIVDPGSDEEGKHPHNKKNFLCSTRLKCVCVGRFLVCRSNMSARWVQKNTEETWRATRHGHGG